MDKTRRWRFTAIALVTALMFVAVAGYALAFTPSEEDEVLWHIRNTAHNFWKFWKEDSPGNFPYEVAAIKEKLDVVTNKLDSALDGGLAGVEGINVTDFYSDYVFVGPDTSESLVVPSWQAGRVFVVTKIVIENTEDEDDFSHVFISAAVPGFWWDIAAGRRTRGVNSETVLDFRPGLPLVYVLDGSIYAIADRILVHNDITSNSNVVVHVYGYFVDPP